MRTTLLAILLLFTCSLARAELRVGDPAPPLAITEWVRGKPVEVRAGHDGDPVVVLEFWATWCGPCIRGIPHLDEVQAKYGDKVAIVGVTHPDPNNTLEKVKEFVDERVDSMQYRVAWDGDGTTWERYMTAADQNGIPTAFIVDRDGQLAWVGHPMQMDRPLAAIVAGEWDADLAAIRQGLEKRWQTRFRQGDSEAALRALESLAALDPEDAHSAAMATWVALSSEEPKKAEKWMAAALERGRDDPEVLGMLGNLLRGKSTSKKLAKLALKAARRHVEIAPDASDAHFGLARALASEKSGGKETSQHVEKAIELASEDAPMLNQIAWTLLTEAPFAGSFAKLALRAAEKSNALTDGEDPSILDTLALAKFETGSKEEAVELEEKALEKVRGANANPRVLAEFEERLESFREGKSPVAVDDDDGRDDIGRDDDGDDDDEIGDDDDDDDRDDGDDGDDDDGADDGDDR